MVLGMLFLPLFNADMGFAEQLVSCLLAATKRVEFVDRRGFSVAAVDQAELSMW